MPRPGYQIALAVLSVLSACAADTDETKKDDKTTPTPISVKLALDKTEPPIPVKYAFSVELADYCVTAGLVSGGKFEVAPKEGCKPGTKKTHANIDDLAAAFGKDTEYVVQKGDKSHLLFFCAAKACNTKDDESRITTAIRSLAKPSPRYYEDRPVPAGVQAEDLAAAVEKISEGTVTGRVLSPPSQIRLETDEKLDPPDAADLLDQIANATPDSLKKLHSVPLPFNAGRVALPFFCIATKLDGPDPSVFSASTPCADATRKVQAANAVDIATALTVAGEKIKVVADSPSSIIVSCGASKCDSDAIKLITGSVAAMATPRPAYVEYLQVLPTTASYSAARMVIWSKGVITADILADDLIRLSSNSRVPGVDIATFRRRLLDEGFGDPGVVPTQRLFYSDAGAVVSSLAGSAPVPTPLAPGTTPPDTTGLSSEATAPGSSATATAGTAAPATAAAPATTAPAAATPAASTAAPTPPSATPAAPVPGPTSTAASSTFASGMTRVGDTVVFSGSTSVNDGQRARLLTLLDLPRPEVLMNMWSLQESSPDGKELSAQSQLIRSAVSIHNEALQNAIEYGWAYLSRQMQNPEFFDKDFASYLTKRFVGDPAGCRVDPNSPGCISAEDRERWGLCPEDSYCLGYTQVFKPLRPTLTNILLGLMAAKEPFRVVFTAIGCMEGKYEVYDSCFPERSGIAALPLAAAQPPNKGLPSQPQQCLSTARQRYIAQKLPADAQPSCEDLDLAALDAQRQCHVSTALPLGCFTIQAAKSFVPYHGFSTFTNRQLNGLAEQPIAAAQQQLPANETSFSTTPLGLLRSATANFLFNYKMAQQFPREFSPYRLTQSAQELNAEFNPLVVAFNQDVAAFSRDLMQGVEDPPHESHWYTSPWDSRNKSFVADGLVTVRGISGLESLVDTETMSSFSAPQFQTLPGVINNLAGFAGGSQPADSGSTTTTSNSTVTGGTTTGTSTTAPTAAPPPPPPSSNLLSILPGGLTKASLPLALAAAISPTPAFAQVGRQLTMDVTPHALPGASSAELDVKLWAQEDSPPTLYKDRGTSTQNDPISRVARHNVFTRVRVESVKLFEVSSFSALVQRPRTKFPLIPPFVEIPFINDIIGLPLPGAKVYYRSTAIVSAIIVPTASDLAFGIEFAADRVVAGGFFRRITATTQLPRQEQKLYQFNLAEANCFATQPPLAITTTSAGPNCTSLTFASLPPDR